MLRDAAQGWRGTRGVLGTVARKGDPTTDRPHRRAEIEERPILKPVTRDQLQWLAAQWSDPRQARSGPEGERRGCADRGPRRIRPPRHARRVRTARVVSPRTPQWVARGPVSVDRRAFRV